MVVDVLLSYEQSVPATCDDSHTISFTLSGNLLQLFSPLINSFLTSSLSHGLSANQEREPMTSLSLIVAIGWIYIYIYIFTYDMKQVFTSQSFFFSDWLRKLICHFI